jgi:hypothetical protein
MLSVSSFLLSSTEYSTFSILKLKIPVIEYIKKYSETHILMVLLVVFLLLLILQAH